MGRAWLGVVLTVALAAGCTGGTSKDTSSHETRSARPVEMEAFMRARATSEQIDAVRTALARSRLVRKFTFVSQQDAYREFGRLFADQPDLVATVDPLVLPMSFRIVPVDGAARRLARSLERLAGVDEVKTAPVVADCEKAKKRLPPKLREQLSRFC